MNETKEIPVPRKKKRKKKLIILLSILGALIIFRLILPYIVLHYVNKVLATKMTGYYGHAEDIDLALIRGAYVIKGLEILKLNTDNGKSDTIPFFTAPAIDLSVHWGALFKGTIAGELIFDKPVLNFVSGKHEKGEIKTDTADFRAMLKKLMPLKINRFEIREGEVHYIDPYSNPRVDVFLSNIQAVAINLTNVVDKNELLPARLNASATAYGGRMEVNVKFNILKKHPTFDMNATIKDANLVHLNDFFKAYGNFDLKRGIFEMYTEFAAKDGEFNGYVKPLLKDLDIVQWNKDEGPPLQVLWETFVGTVAEVLQNQRKEQLATKIPIHGKFDNPDTQLWTAVKNVLINAFIQALKPSIDNTINIAQVPEERGKGPFKNILGDKEGKDKNKEKDPKQKD